MDDPFRDTFMVEMEDFLPKMEVVHQSRTTGAEFERILVVGNRRALLGCHGRPAIACRLVGFASLSKREAGAGRFCRASLFGQRFFL
jgi:hypothetical protein